MISVSYTHLDVYKRQILSSDGRVLAQTRVSEDGTETRHYPYDSLFAHVAGYSDHGKTGLEDVYKRQPQIL